MYNYTKSNKNANNTNNNNLSINKNNTSSNSKNTSINFNDKNTLENYKIKAPDFKLSDLSGKEISLNDYKGKKIFLNFWASWCGPCQKEMPDIQKLYEETKNSNLIILAVNLGDDKYTVEKFIENNKYTFPVLINEDTSVADKYNVVSIPTSFFIDENGNIVYTHTGLMTIEDMKIYIDKLK
jgi:peroxiredoxin